MLFSRLFRLQCLQTTNKLGLLSWRLRATGEMFSNKKKSGGVPDRWLDYRAVGERIPGTRFIAFKVPLRSALTRLLPRGEAFGPWELLDVLKEGGQELGLIIDLTFTTRYYKVHDLPTSLLFLKIFTEGHQVPSDPTILSFKRAVRHFLRENPHNDKLIGVHCTHGLNRTGYLVCRYLIDVDGFDPGEAVQLFNSSRGHPMERQNYLDDLQSGPRRSNKGMDQSEQDPTRGLAVTRPPCLPVGQEDEQQWSHEDVRQRPAPNQSWGRGGGANHQSHPRGGGGTNWSQHRDVHHQSWRGETNHQSHLPRGGSPRRGGGSNQSHPRAGFNQSRPRGGFNHSRDWTRDDWSRDDWPHHRDQGFPMASPWFPPGGEGLLPPPPRWIHPSRAAAAAGPPAHSGTKRPRDRPPQQPQPPEWRSSSPHSHHHHHHAPSSSSSSSQRGKKSRDHRRHDRPPGPPRPSQLPRYVPAAFPPDHE